MMNSGGTDSDFLQGMKRHCCAETKDWGSHWQKQSAAVISILCMKKCRCLHQQTKERCMCLSWYLSDLLQVLWEISRLSSNMWWNMPELAWISWSSTIFVFWNTMDECARFPAAFFGFQHHVLRASQNSTGVRASSTFVTEFCDSTFHNHFCVVSKAQVMRVGFQSASYSKPNCKPRPAFAFVMATPTVVADMGIP